MSNYYLCDTCGRTHEVVNFDQVVCDRGEIIWFYRRKVIFDNQTPYEVCKYWKPKEAL